MAEPELQGLDPQISYRFEDEVDDHDVFDTYYREGPPDDYDDQMDTAFTFNQVITEDTRLNYEKFIDKAEEDISNISPQDIGQLRDIHTELRKESDVKSDKDRARIDVIIDKWNNFNPDFVSLEKEYILSTKDLGDLYKERDKLKSQLTLEDSKDLENQLVRVEDRITQKEKEVKYYRNILFPTRSIYDIMTDRELSLVEKLRELFRRKGVRLGTIITAINVIIASIGIAVGVIGQNTKSIPTPTPKPIPAPSGQNYIKDGIKKFSEWLKSLSTKNIPTVFSFILSILSEVVGFTGNHLTAVLLSILIIYYGRRWR